MIVVTLALLACTEDVKTPDAPMCESPAVWYPDADGDG